jgi:hypothetical protein
MRAPRVKGHPPMPFQVSHVHLTRLQGVPDPLPYLPALPALPPSLKAPLTRRGDNDGQLEGNRPFLGYLCRRSHQALPRLFPSRLGD